MTPTYLTSDDAATVERFGRRVEELRADFADHKRRIQENGDRLSRVSILLREKNDG